MRRMTIKRRPFSPGNYVLKLRRPLSQHLSFYDAVEDLLIPLEGGRKGPGEVSLYHLREALLLRLHSL